MTKNVYTTQPPADAVHIEIISAHGNNSEQDNRSLTHQADSAFQKLADRLNHTRISKEEAKAYEVFHVYGASVSFTPDGKAVAFGTVFGIPHKKKHKEKGWAPQYA